MVRLLMILLCMACVSCTSDPAIDPCELIAGIDVAEDKRDRGWPLGVLATIIEQNFGILRSYTWACRDPP